MYSFLLIVLLFDIYLLNCVMCLQRPIVTTENDIVSTVADFKYDIDLDHCDYLDSDSKLKLEDTDLSIFQLNIRGLYNKLDKLKSILNDSFEKNAPDVLLLCETWMNKSSPKIHLPGYQVFETRRLHKRGGGVCILVKNHIVCRPYKISCLENDENSEIEYCAIESKLGNKTIIYCSMYRAPNTNQNRFLSTYKKFLEELKSKPLVVGLDHNLDFLKCDKHRNTQIFIEQNLDYGLVPLITRPTRVTHTSATLIDNIIVSQNLSGKHVCQVMIDDISDHFPTVCVLENANPLGGNKIAITSRDTREKNIKLLKDSLSSIPIDPTVNDVNVDFTKLHENIVNNINKCCPIVTRNVSRKKFRHEPWLSHTVLKCCNNQKRLYTKSLKEPDNNRLHVYYKNYRNILNKLKRHCKTDFYKTKCVEYKRNTRKLWQLINNCIGHSNDKSNIINCIKIGNVEQYDSKVIAESFGEFFSNIGKKYANKIPKPKKSITDYLNVIPRNVKSLYCNPTSCHEIEKLINKLPNKLSSGHDNIDNVILKKVSKEISLLLEPIFNASINMGIFPDIMKIADVSPLYKSKEKYILSNYRPISLLITISKLLEKIMYKRTYKFLTSTKQFYDSQYGFRSKHSCEHAISELMGNVIKERDKGNFTVSLFLDLSKAFDTLEHEVLLKKLEIYGIRGITLDWFKSYLTNRKLRAKCNVGLGNFELSQNFNIEYGTPQGSCLGPLLFIIFCNDIHLHLTYLSCIQFADDTTLYCSGKSLDLLEFSINYDLEHVADWFKANKLTLNIDKTVAMIFSPTGRTSKREMKIKLGDQTVPISDSTKFLGLWINNSLNWNTHITKLITKLKQNLGLLQKSKNLLTASGLKLIYFAHIFSHLSYCMSVWGGMTNKSVIANLQKIQNRCIKIICPKKAVIEGRKQNRLLSVIELILLEHCKLGHRITHQDLPLGLLKCLQKNQYGLPLAKTHKYSTRRKRELNIPLPKSKEYKSSFLCQGIECFNKLPDDLRKEDNYKLFVSKLKSYLLK